MKLTLVGSDGTILRQGSITESGGYGIQAQDILSFAEGTLQPGAAIDVVVLAKHLCFRGDTLRYQPDLILTVEPVECS